MPCDPEPLARLQAEHLPPTSEPEPPQPAAAATARQLCREGHITLRPEAELLLEDELSPQAYFQLLLAADLLADARRVLAHAMPKRRALWWACLCTQDAYRGQLPEHVALAVETVVRFVGDPSEPNRREAERVGRSLAPSSLEACLTTAAFFSGGSISLPDLPAVPSPPFVTGRLAGVCVYLASVRRSAARYKDHLRQYLSIGVGIARGENLSTDFGTDPTRLDPGGASPLHTMHVRRAATDRSNRKLKSIPDVAR